MFVSHRSIARLGMASLIGALVASFGPRAEAACEQGSATCSVGSGAVSARVKKRLGTEIDSGWMEKGSVKIRTRFTIDPVGGEPIVALDMPKGAGVEASWPEKGFIDLRPVTGEAAEGAMNVHYTLTPSLDASIYGVSVSYNANELVNMVPGAAFDYDSQAKSAFSPWGFAGAQVAMPAPALEDSTIFSISFATLGVGTGIVTGALAIQAAAKPTFKYVTKQVQLDGAAVTAADGSTRLPAVDGDAMDVAAYVTGELSFTGTLDVKPVVKIDSVAGVPTFGYPKLSFSAVSKDLGGETPTPVAFDRTTIHVPLPNVKVPAQPLDMGMADPGKEVARTVSIDSTGEMESVLSFESSDPQFVVPSGQVRVGSKSKYDLKVAFKPNGGPASATITVRSNDPDSPEQTFRVAANGAVLDPSDPESKSGGASAPEEASESGGCSAAPSGSRAPSGFAALGLGLGFLLVRRRRS